MLLLLLAAFMQNVAPDEIVVIAKRQTCTAFLRGKNMSDRALDQYAKEWKEGVAVRVRAPSRSDYRCLAKIAFKLSDRGVKLIEFIR